MPSSECRSDTQSRLHLTLSSLTPDHTRPLYLSSLALIPDLPLPSDRNLTLLSSLPHATHADLTNLPLLSPLG